MINNVCQDITHDCSYYGNENDCNSAPEICGWCPLNNRCQSADDIECNDGSCYGDSRCLDTCILSECNANEQCTANVCEDIIYDCSYHM